ncbi:MAG: OmpA family protein [Gammaproteobacteria bacterium]|nr:OmpA family protein [Gammaproteobacteria bacterium]
MFCGFPNKTLPLAGAMALLLSGCSMTDKNQPPPPAPEPVAAPTPPPPSYVIKDVNFDFDKATLKPMASQVLDGVASELQQQPGVPYEVGGHTDSIGSTRYNQDLSERRAGTVRDYLVGRGVSGSQLSTRGYGESMPVASNKTAEGRAENRRVEIRPVK